MQAQSTVAKPAPKVAKTVRTPSAPPHKKQAAVLFEDKTPTPIAVPKVAKRSDSKIIKKCTVPGTGISASELRSILRMGYAIVAPVEELLERVERALPPIDEEEVGDLDLSDQDTEPYDQDEEDSDLEDMVDTRGVPSHDV